VEGINEISLNSEQPLKGKKILLGVCGSIAAYKSVFLLRLLMNKGAEVHVIMTQNAEKFVTPLTFSTLSQNPVFVHLWHETTGNQDWSKHVQIAQNADLIVIAPATMNTIAKLALGLCDDALTATVFSASCPILIAPAMDREMYASPQNQKNLSILHELGYHILPTNNGFLASGLKGEGRMLEPVEILENILFHLSPKILHQKKILINVGPTQEAIDPVRFISNHSSGKMGIAIAQWAYRMGAQVTVVAGPVNVSIPMYLNTLHVKNAIEMYELMKKIWSDYDFLIATAAVADFRPSHISHQKIKKIDNLNTLTLELTKNPDILFELSKQKKNHQKVIGFALETQNALENAKNKLLKKQLDWIVLNTMEEKNSTFGYDTNKVWFISKNKTIETHLLHKEQIAIELLFLLVKEL